MQTSMFNIFNEMNQNGLDTLRKIGEINARVGERLFQQQTELANAWIETTGKGMELMGRSKGYQDLMAGQAKLAQEYGQECLKGYRSSAEVLTEARDALTKVLEEGAQTAAQTVTETVKAGTKAAA
ncbi:MAG: phasin family protein [Chromatiales bacterium]|nr:phasin family protein [Chromatiales bacterium]